MEKKVTFKTIYLLLVITVGLLGLGLGSTYAMFTKEAEIDNPITFTSNLSYDSDVIETIDLILKPTEIKDFSLTVNNNTGVVTNYAIAYIDENYNIDIYGKVEDSTCKSIGTLENGKTCLFNGTVRNDGSEEIILTIAILSSDSSLILASNMETIPLRENLVTHITNLYNNSSKTKVTNNEIEYNYATSEFLMNDRLGGTTTSLDGGNIRYYGANPNNYIYFNCSDYNNQTSSTCELWRIIGIFDGKVKIVRNDSIGDIRWDETNSNNWARPATLNTYLNGEYYSSFKNDQTRGKITNVAWNLGGISNTNVYSNQLYDYERGDMVPTDSPSTWIGKIALMYPSDYGYATDFNECTKNVHDYIDPACYNNDWIFVQVSQYLLSPNLNANDYIAAIVGGEPRYFGMLLVASSTSKSTSTRARPTLYLNPDELIQGGTGSESNPYELSNSYGKCFNGASDYIDTGYAGENFGKTITIGARFKLESTNSTIVSNYESGGFGLEISAGKPRFAIHTAGSYLKLDASNALDTNSWHTIVGTYDGTTMQLYVDGVPSGAKTLNNTDITVSSIPIVIGGNPNPGVEQYIIVSPFIGQVSDVFLTKEVLDANTIANNFTNTFIYDEDDSTYFYYHEH